MVVYPVCIRGVGVRFSLGPHFRSRKLIMAKNIKKICSRGHKYQGNSPCPVCYPGYYKRGEKEITTLLNKTNKKLFTTHKLKFKNVFGATGGYVNDKIFISYGTFGVALKLPKEVLNTLFLEKDIKHLKYFPKGHAKKEYAVLPKRVLKNKKRMKKLVDDSIKYMLSLKRSKILTNI